eukprot:5762024-Lingulodinium_polyedra.AAC.1
MLQQLVVIGAGITGMLVVVAVGGPRLHSHICGRGLRDNSDARHHARTAPGAVVGARFLNNRT